MGEHLAGADGGLRRRRGKRSGQPEGNGSGAGGRSGAEGQELAAIETAAVVTHQ
jgi:hypothetical protein